MVIVVHLRIVSAQHDTAGELALLERAHGVVCVVLHRDAAIAPPGDVVLCDVSDEQASLIVGDLRTMGVSERGIVDVEQLDASVSTRGRSADRVGPRTEPRECPRPRLPARDGRDERAMRRERGPHRGARLGRPHHQTPPYRTSQDPTLGSAGPEFGRRHLSGRSQHQPED
jgi:hypothetical protein